MTQDEIIQMARQAGFIYNIEAACTFQGNFAQIEAFAKLVAAKERKECAKVCDNNQYVSPYKDLGALIRARGEA